MKIIVKNGEGRPINLGKFYSPQWASFESTVEWHDCPESTEDGEYEAYQVMQEHLPFYQENEWTDCVLDGYDPIVCVSKGSETRVIWRIVPQPQEGKIIPCSSPSLTKHSLSTVFGIPKKEEAKTVEGKTPFDVLSKFTGDDSFKLQQNHRNRIIMAMKHWGDIEYHKGLIDSNQQNKALMEENSKLREALEYCEENTADSTIKNIATKALKRTPLKRK